MPSSYTVAFTAGEHRRPYGTVFPDASGGAWMYVKASTVAVVGSLVYLAPGTDPWQATITASGGGTGLTTAQGLCLGVQASTANSTTQDVFIQIRGPMTVALDSTSFRAGQSLTISTTIAGALSVTTTGVKVYGAYTMASGGAGLSAPVLASVNAPNGLITHLV